MTSETCDHSTRSVSEEVRAIDGVTDVQVATPTGLVNATAVQSVPVAAVQAVVSRA